MRYNIKLIYLYISMYYISLDYIIYKFYVSVDKVKNWFEQQISKLKTSRGDPGYVVIENVREERYIGYDEIWNLD